MLETAMLRLTCAADSESFLKTGRDRNTDTRDPCPIPLSREREIRRHSTDTRSVCCDHQQARWPALRQQPPPRRTRLRQRW
eukprot:2551149-Rhodomonas_salina.4